MTQAIPEEGRKQVTHEYSDTGLMLLGQQRRLLNSSLPKRMSREGRKGNGQACRKINLSGILSMIQGKVSLLFNRSRIEKQHNQAANVAV
jgi:hypothetical protein